MLIKQVLDFIHNYFVKNEYCGSFKIENGSLVSDELINGQYFYDKRFTFERWCVSVSCY